MSYIQRKLLNNEKVIYETRLNSRVFLKPVSIAIAGLIIIAANYQNVFYLLPGIILSIIGVYFILLTLLKRKGFEFVVTDKRVLIKFGILRSQSQEIMLYKVEGIYIEQGILDKLFDSGSIIIKGTGGTSNVLPNIDHPLQFRMAINNQIENLNLV